MTLDLQLLKRQWQLFGLASQANAASDETNPEKLLLVAQERRLLIDAKAGFTYQQSGRFLHSRHNPVQEAQRQAMAIAAGKEQTVLFFGAGLGYNLAIFLKKNQACCVWIEPDWQLLAGALALHSFEEHAARLQIIAGPDPGPELDKILKYLNNDAAVFYFHRASADPRLTEIKEYCERFLNRRAVNEATLSRFEREWAFNTIKNWPALFMAHPIARLYGALAGEGAVVCAAGPSLAKDLEALRNNRDRYFLICVDTALSVVLSAGLDPDFIVTVDPQPVNSYYLEGYAGNAIVVADPTTAFRTQRLIPPAQLAFFASPFALARLFESFWKEEIGQLASGGSVTTNAFDLARKLGCTRLLICGLDLSFPNTMVHAPGALLEERLNLKECREFRREMHNQLQRSALPVRYLPGKDGKLPTNDKMIMFYNWFEKHLAPEKIHGIELALSMNSPLRMHGAKAAFPQDFLKPMPRAKKINLTALLQKESAPFQREEFLKELEKIQTGLVEIVNICQQGLAILQDAKLNHNRNRILDRINAMDQALLARHELLGLLGQAMQKAIANAGSTGVEKAMEATEELYSALLSAGRQYRQWIGKALQILSGIYDS